ncbi:helix-turn-helix domain-containing protein [Yersinia ruckeri]|nr:helix-turn-helix domain-containing protein [Yersinia ruckeri]EKN4693353.1 helix-turn-helix domain-containing protein [Yersinia ruckeri]
MTSEKGSASKILERLLSSYGVTSQKALSECLDIPANNISGWIQRDRVPGNSIIKCALDTDADLRWLMTGEFEKSNSDRKGANLRGKRLYEKILASGGKAVLRRMMDAYGFSTQKEFGDLLGIPAGTISTWIRRDFFPGDVVVTCALDTRVSLEWLSTGQGSPQPEVDKTLISESVVSVDKYQLATGLLKESGQLLIDKNLMPKNVIRPAYIDGNETSWLIDQSVTNLANGRWLINFDDNYDIYDVIRSPGNKLTVCNNIANFSCSISDIKAVGLVIITIERNN